MKALVLLIFCSITSALFAQVTPPYSTSFEGAMGTLNTNFPEGWTWEDLNTIPLGNQGWQIIKNTPSITNARTDSTAAHMFSHSSETNNDWLYTPGMQCQAGMTYDLSFWYARAALFASVEKLSLHVGTTASSTNMGTALWMDTNIGSGTYQEAALQWIAPADGVYFFGFHYFSEEFQFILLLDDVSIVPISTSISEQAIAAPTIRVAGDRLTVELNVASNASQLLIVDGAGRNVMQRQLISANATLDLATLPQGLYVATVPGTSTSKRFVITR